MQKRVSVRNLVEFILRSGSIDSGATGRNRLEEGARVHRTLQKAEGYQAEVFLSLTETRGGVEFTVEGRADGIITDDSGVTVDEIKSTLTPLELIGEDFSRVHWAQAMCYGHMYCAKNGLEQINVRLTYYEMETCGIKRFARPYQASELRSFYEELLDEYAVWTNFEREWGETSTQSMRELRFPYESYRKGQREFAVSAYRTIVAGSRLFAMAPTGVGKTISALFPSIKAMGEGNCGKIFYLTARTVTRQAAHLALEKMRECGLRAKSVIITAKDKICFMASGGVTAESPAGSADSASPTDNASLAGNASPTGDASPADNASQTGDAARTTPGPVCKPSRCRYADGHFDRVNDAIMDALQSCDDINAESASDFAKRHCVCPFELVLDISLWCDVVICDYNYLFDPQVHLKRFFSDGGEFIFLIDEAHNLADRAREMYSASISKRGFIEVKKALGKSDKALRATLTKLNKLLLEKRRECEGSGIQVEKEPTSELNTLLELFSLEFSGWLGENPDPDRKLLETYFGVLSYLKITELFDERYTVIYESRQDGELIVKQFCADPSLLIAERLSQGRAAIFFSATLTPAGYFTSVLGGSEGCRYLALPSPFPRENLLLLVADDISTKYKDRNSSLERVADMIFHTTEGKNGNYIAYFPSYSYLSAVYTVFCEKYPDVLTVRQKSGMAEDERDEFLALFKGGGNTMVAFCVLGGVFSEGVDLVGDRLIGTVIVGVGLPQINTELDIVSSQFGGQGTGFDFAYRFPGMNKVLQAAGRVIRSEEDRGVVLLIDARYTTRQYTELFPGHWNGWRRIRGVGELSEELSAFWYP